MHRQQEKLQADILNSLPQSVVILQNESDHVEFVNTPFLNLFNTTGELLEDSADALKKILGHLNRKMFLPLAGDLQRRDCKEMAIDSNAHECLSLR
jgi:nitrogen-specific signal transduction histidine kinase